MLKKSENAAAKLNASGVVRRWLPVIILLGLMVLVFAMGWHRHLSFQTMGENYAGMQSFIAKNFVVSVLLYMAIYIAVVALSLPGGLFMTLSGGLLFGAAVGVPVTIVAATIGATLIFLVARSSIGEVLAAKAGPWLDKLRGGFQENAMNYMLFLRLVPAFPFVVVNLAPAVLGVPLRTFVIGTLFGIIPGTTAYSLVGASLGAPLEAENKKFAACIAEKSPASCDYSVELSSLVSRELIFAGVALGIVALIPVAYNWYKKWRKARAA